MSIPTLPESPSRLTQVIDVPTSSCNGMRPICSSSRRLASLRSFLLASETVQKRPALLLRGVQYGANRARRQCLRRELHHLVPSQTSASRELIEDTIYALSTPPGRSAIAVIRISGSRSRDVLKFVSLLVPQSADHPVRYINLCVQHCPFQNLDMLPLELYIKPKPRKLLARNQRKGSWTQAPWSSICQHQRRSLAKTCSSCMSTEALLSYRPC
jgi:hypothetical protein